MKSISTLISILLMMSSVFAQDLIKDGDEGLLVDDFGVTPTVMPKPQHRPRRVILLGRIERGTISIAHFNDLDLTGVAGLLGYPDDDDLGRTAGLVINYLLEGERGSFEINLENWLFSQDTNNPDVDDEQTFSERSVVSIRSRRFTGNNQNQYVIMGLEFGAEVQKPFIMTFVQKFVHEITPSRTRPFIDRDHSDYFLNPIFGIGRNLDILQHEQINIFVNGELEAQASSDFFERSNVRVRASLNTSIAGWSDHDTPLIRLKLFLEHARYIDGEYETTAGLQMFIGINLGKVFFELGINVFYFDSELDRQYEGGGSWNTALFFRFTFRPDRNENDDIIYLINDDDKEDPFTPFLHYFY
jgi:hypothetical protein